MLFAGTLDCRVHTRLSDKGFPAEQLGDRFGQRANMYGMNPRAIHDDRSFTVDPSGRLLICP